jgi:glutathione synthase/RimK-type ligase-like ATP-grasp enzyme/ribosomal protein S18 acetylase RimI-like enzyme
MNLKFEKATKKDIPFLEKIEQLCFPDFQRTSQRMLRLSISSPFQSVLICKVKYQKAWIKSGSLIFHHYKHTLRLYSIAVLPDYQGDGLGGKFMDYCIEQARARGYERISLEAYEENQLLIDWYKKFGFVQTELIPDYYEAGKNAVKMKLQIKTEKSKAPRENLIVVDQANSFYFEMENVKVITARKYILDKKFQQMKNARVFNLCNSYRYQTTGYYVSLLASARDHRVIPSVATIGDYRNISIIKSISTEIDDLIQKSLNKVHDNKLTIQIFFGQALEEKFKILAARLNNLFETPVLQISFTKSDKWYIQKVIPKGISKLDENAIEQLQDSMRIYFSRKRYRLPRLKNFKYDLAILVNPNEKNPPSNRRGLVNFKNAADKRGFYTEFITSEDLNRLSEFDALLIRETTNVNNYTYSFSRMAYSEGLVALDDPWSILRCSNKIYLYERMALNNIRMPFSKVIARGNFKPTDLKGLNYPMVLKQPDGSFSLGVKKVADYEELMEALKGLFKTSELIVAQEYLPSDYDWRIGILNHQALFACKYFMAKGHWQIYNWKNLAGGHEGDFETVPIHLVPPKILKTAVKAASLIGDGLYGVDLKEVKGEVYLIEVNDNPNIDAGVEDKLLKNELYEKIIDFIFDRIEMSRNVSKFIALDPI